MPDTAKSNQSIKAFSCGIVTVTLVVTFASLIGNVVHHDVWHEMAVAREAFANAFPVRDVYAYSGTGIPYIAYEWGAGALALAAVSVGGGYGLAALNLLLAAVWATLIGLRLRSEKLPFAIAAVCAALMILPVIASFKPVTAQVYSAVLFGILLTFLALDKGGNRKWIAAWLPLWIVWISLHGGIVVAGAFLAATILERVLRREPWKHLAWVLAAMLALIPVNPNGFSYYGYLVRTFTMPRTIISEWDPLWLVKTFDLDNALFLILAGVMIYTLWSERWRGIPGVIGMLMLAAGAARAWKVMPLFALAWLFAIPRPFSRTPLGLALARFYDRWHTAAGSLALALLVFAAAITVKNRPWLVSVPGTPDRSSSSSLLLYAVGPVEYMQSVGFKGNLLTSFMDGSYVLWKLGPKVKIGCDSRYDLVYSDEWVTKTAAAYTKGDDTAIKEVLAAHPTDAVLVRTKSPLLRKLAAKPEWRRVYRDDGYHMYARKELKLPVRDRSGQIITGSIP